MKFKGRSRYMLRLFVYKGTSSWNILWISVQNYGIIIPMRIGERRNNP